MSSLSLNLFLVFLVIVTMLISSCSATTSQLCGDRDKAWAANLALWKSQEIVDYDMVVERYRNPTYAHVPFLIKVRNGKNVSMEPARENKGLELTDGYEAVATVEQMFETGKQACENGGGLTVGYDSVRGNPVLFGFDGNPKAVADGRDGFKIISADWESSVFPWEA